MQLFGTTRSPYVCKCRLFAMEKGIDCEFVDISPRDAAVAAANPLAKIPTLLRDDGNGLYDSAVIVDYLDGVKPEPRLVPADFDDRIEVLRWAALADGILEALIEINHDLREPEEKQKGPEFHARQQKKIDGALARIDADLGSRDYCFGNSLSLADIAVGAAIVYLDRIQPDSGWRPKHPNVARLWDKLAARDSFKKL